MLKNQQAYTKSSRFEQLIDELVDQVQDEFDVEFVRLFLIDAIECHSERA